jgi:hypothetical protein
VALLCDTTSFAPLGLMNRKEGEPPGASYIQITTNGNPSDGPKWPTFEPPPNLHAELLEEETFKDQEMDIDRGRRQPLAARQNHGCRVNVSHKPRKPGSMSSTHHE